MAIADGHADHEAAIATAGLKQQDSIFTRPGQTIGKHTARRASANDNEIKLGQCPPSATRSVSTGAKRATKEPFQEEFTANSAIGKGNRAVILALELSPKQQGFVASNTGSLAEVWQDYEAIIYRFMIDRR
ncbi:MULTISPECIES: hypothetical protein [Phyllobacteriaceae]|uniref:hypothetical protein n=1 Tax=Phyllobacteriaceae TaxID=69277 RepID=UPI00184854DE|nr:MULTISPECIES: hypothetical protein [Mesorhizobium]MDQ0331274.1 hypothetical protein [Mesorhizobium sp. YL-MeA3-2017]